MKKPLCLALVCALAVTACSHLREPTDAQLATFLQSNHAQPGPKAPLDAHSVDCLRAWSDDADLLKGLSPRVAAEDGKKACHSTLDTRLADATRNPQKFTFAEVTTPKVVARALALQQAREVAMGNQPIPQALRRPVSPPAPKPLPPDTTVDLGVSGAKLIEAETLCQSVQKAAADPRAKNNLKRFAAFCVGDLRRLRGSMETAAHHGATPERLAAMAVSADHVANLARNLLAQGNP